MRRNNNVTRQPNVHRLRAKTFSRCIHYCTAVAHISLFQLVACVSLTDTFAGPQYIGICGPPVHTLGLEARRRCRRISPKMDREALQLCIGPADRERIKGMNVSDRKILAQQSDNGANQIRRTAESEAPPG